MVGWSPPTTALSTVIKDRRQDNSSCFYVFVKGGVPVTVGATRYLECGAVDVQNSERRGRHGVALIVVNRAVAPGVEGSPLERVSTR